MRKRRRDSPRSLFRVRFRLSAVSQDGEVMKRTILRRPYTDALNHVTNYCQGRKGDYRSLIRSTAQAKGLGKRVAEDQAQEFFNGVVIFR